MIHTPKLPTYLWSSQRSLWTKLHNCRTWHICTYGLPYITELPDWRAWPGNKTCHSEVSYIKIPKCCTTKFTNFNSWILCQLEPLYSHPKATQHSVTYDNTGKQRHKLSTLMNKCQLHSKTSLLKELSARTSALYQGWTRTEVPHLKWQLSSQWAAWAASEPPIVSRQWAADREPPHECKQTKSCDLSGPISTQHSLQDGGTFLANKHYILTQFSQELGDDNFNLVSEHEKLSF